MFRNGLEPWHIILLALVLVLLFGAKRLPDAARGLGRSLRIFKAETEGLRTDPATPASLEATAPAAAPDAGAQLPAETPAKQAAPQPPTA